MGPDLLSWGSKSGEGPIIDLNSMVSVADRAWEGTKAEEVGRRLLVAGEPICEDLGPEHSRLSEQVQRSWGRLVWPGIRQGQAGWEAGLGTQQGPGGLDEESCGFYPQSPSPPPRPAYVSALIAYSAHARACLSLSAMSPCPGPRHWVGPASGSPPLPSGAQEAG